ncbi:hypothetical protein K0651_01795 [Ornithinimicrobium sp. Arc0846-15]|nr:hypothetical protein [Ornithinimicrobium laminariae]
MDEDQCGMAQVALAAVAGLVSIAAVVNLARCALCVAGARRRYRPEGGHVCRK